MANIQKRLIGLLGGSFDPAHRGHLGISKIALKKFKLKKIYWVITKKNPFKNETFYSLDERINFAKKITKTQKKIQTIYLDNIINSSNYSEKPRLIAKTKYLLKAKINNKKIYYLVAKKLLDKK